MNKKNLTFKVASSLDSTLLRATATNQELTQLCSDAQKYGFASVCVNPCNVLFCKKLLSTVKVCTVIGFPLGANTTKVKVAEVKDALKNGACEFDVVINIGAAIDGDFDFVREELNRIASVLDAATLKVILETCYFNKEQLIILGKIALECGANFLKTSTGFGPCGATVEVVKLLNQICNGKAGVKASGGIKTLKDILTFLDAGATRIGTSNAVKIINEIEDSNGVK